MYAQFRRLHKFTRVSVYILIAYAFFLLLLGVITPKVLENKIPTQLSNMTGRTVSVGIVTINPFLLKITIHDLDIKDRTARNTFFSFKQFQLEPLFWKSLFTLTPTLDYVSLSHPKLQISSINDPQGKTVFSFQDVINRIANNSDIKDNKNKQVTEKIALRANKISIINGDIRYQDKAKVTTFHYPVIDASITHVDLLSSMKDSASIHTETLTSQLNQFNVKLHGQKSHTINLAGRFQLNPFIINGQLTIAHFNLPSIWPYASDYINGNLRQGTLSLSSEFDVSEENQQVQFSTINGHITLSDLQLTAQSKPKVSFDTLNISNINTHSKDRSVSIDAVTLNTLIINSIYHKTGIDLAELYRKPKEDAISSSPQTKDNNQEKWLVRLNTVNIKNSQFLLNDNAIAHNTRWHLDPINIEMSDITSTLSHPISYNVSIGLYNNHQSSQPPHIGILSSRGKINHDRKQIDSELTVKEIDLSDFQPYLKPYINIDLQKGLFSTQGNIHSSFDGHNITYTGSADIEGLHINDGLEHQPFLTWSDMTINQLDYNRAHQSLSIDNITFLKPYSKILIDKEKNTNISDIFNTTTAKNHTITTIKSKNNHSPTQKPSKNKTHNTNIAIHSIQIKNGSAYFSDHSLTPSFTSAINNINGKVSSLSSNPKTQATVNFQGKIDQYAPMILQGNINPLITPPQLDLTLDVKGAELTSVNPYSGTYAGYYIDKGQMSLTLNYSLKNNQLEGKNHVVIDQLQLGAASDSKLATSLPVKLAIALLQDRNGIIDLGVDVSGDVNNPSFGIGGIIFTALKNVVVKAVTAPFSLLANLVGSDDELNIINFHVGSSVISNEEQERLKKLSDALKQRPTLKLNVKGHVNENQDAIAIAEAYLHQQLQTVSNTFVPETLTASQLPIKGPLVDALDSLYKKQISDDIGPLKETITQQLTNNTDSNHIEKRLHIAMYNTLIKHQHISEDRLRKLAHQRATNVKTYLVKQQNIDPQRIFLINSRHHSTEEKSSVSITIANK